MPKATTHLIPNNVAPKGSRIFVKDESGRKVGMIPLGRLTPPKGKPLYSFCVLSDVHIVSDYQEHLDGPLIKALEYVNNSDCAFTCILGDLADAGSSDHYTEHYESIIVGHATKPVYAIAGNHDTIWGYPTDERMMSYTGIMRGYPGMPHYYAIGKNGASIEPVKMYATAPVKHGIIGDNLWINGVKQTAYKLVEFEGDFYFITDGHVIARSTSVTLSAANIGGLTYADGTPIPTGEYSFDADGKMVIKNGLYNGQLYINNVLQRCYKLYKYNGDYYFVTDGNLVAKDTTASLTADNIAGQLYDDGTAIPAGKHRFDEYGRLMRQNGLMNRRLYINYVLQTAYKLVSYGGNFYFISDGDKIATDTTVTLTDEHIGGLTYDDGSPIQAGDHYFDAEGKMDLTQVPDDPTTETVTRVFANEAVSEGDLLVFLGHHGKDHNLNGQWFGGEPFSAEELAWLENLLAANLGKRIMIFFHPYITGGAGDLAVTERRPPDLWTPSGSITTDTGADFLNILKRYPGAILFNGHSHYRFRTQEEDSKAIIHKPDDESYTSVHVPSLTKLRDMVNGQRVDLAAGDPDYGGEGYIVDVYPDCIHLRGRDFVNNIWVGIGTYKIETTL